MQRMFFEKKYFTLLYLYLTVLMALIGIFSPSKARAVSFSGPKTNDVGLAPMSVTTGDFNGDGKLDLAVVTSSRSNNVSILLGNGNGTFQTAVNYSAGLYPVSVIACDFNGDGKLDLAVANSSSSDVSILLGNGDGTFQEALNYSVGTSPVSMIAGDFNGDGRLDLAIASNSDISILLGNGDGTFQTVASYSVLNPYSVTAGDFNRDGKLDLAVANIGSNDVLILLGNGDGTFQTAVSYSAGTHPYSITTGNFNGDGKLDLAVANNSSNDVSILLGNGDGTFHTAVNYSVGTYPISVIAGDFDGDGKLDLVVANYGSNDISILLGNGDGTFHTAVNYSVGTYPISVIAGDFDGDGKFDLAVANNGTNDVSILLNTTVIVVGQSNDLSLTMTGTGSGKVLFSLGFNCSGTCRQEFPNGTTVTLSPVAAGGSIFSGWTGCDSVNGTDCTVSMNSVRSVIANFTRQSPGTGTLYGRVTTSWGSGVANALVRVVREYESASCSAPSCMLVNTDSYGNYLIGNIVPGTYIGAFLNQPVQFGTSGGSVYTTNQYYNNKHSMASADLVAVNEGSTIELDAVYPLFGQISGMVTDMNGAGIGNIAVQVYNLDEEYIDAGWTDTSGNYTVQHVPYGTYKIRFRANNAVGQLPAQNLMTQVAYVTVAASNTVVTGINTTISTGKKISGRITNKDGLPIAGTAVVADLYGNGIASASTDATGAYTAMGIPPGSYRVLFYANPGNPVDPTKLYSREYYGGDLYAAGVTVTADADLSDINGVLEASGPAISVQVFKDFGVEIVGMSTYRSFTITNRGTADLVLGSLSKTGDDFKILNDRCSGEIVAPAKICTFQINFIPQSEGTKTGVITVPSNSALVNISLTGSGGAATGNSGTTAVPYGDIVPVSPTSDVSVIFTGVTSEEGTVTATALTTLKPISNFRLLNGASYDITTTATFTGMVTVCITYDPATMSSPANEQNLKLFHYSGGAWQDITISVNTISHAICGVTSSLSPFAVAEPTSVPFTNLSDKLRIHAGPPPSFDLNASFNLGGSSDGINPLAENVALQVGTYTVTIPAGSFHQLNSGSKKTTYVFSGVVNGATLSLQIAPPSITGNGWNFKASGTPVDLTGLSNPVTVVITIGNDSGTTAINASIF